MATWRKTLSSNQYYEVILNVTQSSQNIANNTSSISWNLQVRKSFGSGFWGLDATASSWKVTIDGTEVSNSSSSYDFRGGAPLTKTIASGTRTITHAGDGSKSIAVSGYWKDNANTLGNATASGTMALSTIPRASELTAFSFASHLKNGVANTINYTTSKKSGGFRHQLQLRDGSTTVFQWDNVGGDGAATIALSASDVNTLLTRMPTSTTKTFTLRLATRSGINGGWIGSAVTRTATGTVHADVKPVLRDMSFSISGSGADKTMNKYVQGYTKVSAIFYRDAGYGSSIKQSTITVQRTDGVNSQVIMGTSGTTANPLSHSGTYRVVYTTTDERGRSTSETSSNFTVHAYSAPRITIFNLFRREATPTTVYVGIAGEFSSIGTSNLATLVIQRRNGSTWEPIGTNNTSNTGSIHREVEVPNNAITSSYEYRGIITDLLGGRAESVDTVSTQQVVMDIYRNQGVAFGKMYEPSNGGAVQIGGGISIEGGIHSDRIIATDWDKVPNDLNDVIKGGTYHVHGNTTANLPEPTWGFLEVIEATPHNTLQKYTTRYTNDPKMFYRVRSDNGAWSAWKVIGVTFGSNANGHYIRLNSGFVFGYKTLNFSGKYTSGSGFNYGIGTLPTALRPGWKSVVTADAYDNAAGFSNTKIVVGAINPGSGYVHLDKIPGGTVTLTLDFVFWGFAP